MPPEPDTSADTDAGGVLPGYAGTIVRAGYAGYSHLPDAVHAWCGAHGLRDLRGVWESDPDGQVRARFMVESKDSPTSPWCSPACPPPPNGASASPTH